MRIGKGSVHPQLTPDDGRCVIKKDGPAAGVVWASMPSLRPGNAVRSLSVVR